MAAAQKLDPVTENASRQLLERLNGQFDLAKAILFGSRARGTARPDSDADLALVLRGPKLRFLPTKLKMSDAAFDVMIETGVDISPMPIWLSEWNAPGSHENPDLLRNIKREGIALL